MKKERPRKKAGPRQRERQKQKHGEQRARRHKMRTRQREQTTKTGIARDYSGERRGVRKDENHTDASETKQEGTAPTD